MPKKARPKIGRKTKAANHMRANRSQYGQRFLPYKIVQQICTENSDELTTRQRVNRQNYERNRAKILEKRHQRYRNDPSFRQRVVNAGKESKIRNKEKNKTKYAQYYQAKRQKIAARYQQNRSRFRRRNREYYKKMVHRIRTMYLQRKEMILKKYQENRETIKQRYQENRETIKQRYQENRETIKQRYQINKASEKYTVEDFLRDIDVSLDQHCEICLRRMFPKSLTSVFHRSTTANFPENVVLPNPFKACYRCAEHLKRPKPHFPSQVYWNNYDPGEIPDCVKILTDVEKKLLCRLICHMKISKFSGPFGQRCLRGQATIFALEVTEIEKQLISELPRAIDGIYERIVVERLEGIERHRQFKVNVQNLKAAFDWLKDNNPLYADVRRFLDRPPEDYDIENIIVQPPTPQEDEQYKEWKNSKIDGNEYTILFGRSHQCDKNRFGEFGYCAGKHGTAIAVIGLTFSHFKPIPKWTRNDLELLLNIGNKLHRTTPELISSDFLRLKKREVQFEIFSHTVGLKIIEIESFQSVKYFTSIMNDHFSRHNHAIVKFKNVPVAIIQHESDYFVYDCNPRSKLGNPCPKRGLQMVFGCESLVLALHVVEKSLKMKTKANKDNKFDILIVEVREIDLLPAEEEVQSESDDDSSEYSLSQLSQLSAYSLMQRQIKFNERLNGLSERSPERMVGNPAMNIPTFLNGNDEPLLIDNLPFDVEWILKVSEEVLISVKQLCSSCVRNDINWWENVRNSARHLYSEEFEQFIEYCRFCPYPPTTSLPERNANHHLLSQFTVYSVPRDGNCFYHATSKSIFGVIIFHLAMRCLCVRAIIDEELNGRKLFSKLCQQSFIEHPTSDELVLSTVEDFLSTVATAPTWATNGSILAFTMITRRKLVILVDSDQLAIFSSASEVPESVPLLITRVDRNHYDSILPKPDSIDYDKAIDDIEVIRTLDFINIDELRAEFEHVQINIPESSKGHQQRSVQNNLRRSSSIPEPLGEFDLNDDIPCTYNFLMPIDNPQPKSVRQVIDIGDNNYNADASIPLVNLRRQTKKKPVNTHTEKRVEELCFWHLFPYGKCGFNESREIRPTPLEYYQLRLMSIDPRFWNVQYLFYALQQVERERASQSVAVCARITRGANNERMQNIASSIHLTMRNIRGTSSYWKKNNLNLLEIVKNLGPATAFMTLSCNDFHWHRMLREMIRVDELKAGRNVDVNNITDEELDELDFDYKKKLIDDNPEIVSRYFELRVQSLLKLLKNPNTFGYKVVDHWGRIELQKRGSSHFHVMLWFENFPDLNTPEGIHAMKKIVSCEIPIDPAKAALVNRYQRHSCTETCQRKGKDGDQQKKYCRFGFPRPLSNETRILDINSKEFLANGRRTILMKRKKGEEYINNYVMWLLEIWQANIDFQFITTDGIVEYIAKYVSKSEPTELSDYISEALSDMNERDTPFHRVLYKVAMALLNHREVGGCEAIYRLYHLPFVFSTRKVEFVNNCPPETRYRLLNINDNDPENNEEFKNVFDRYIRRPRTDEFEDLSLYEFAACYAPHYNVKSSAPENDGDMIGDDIENEQSDLGRLVKRPIITLTDGKTKIRKRTKESIVRGRYFSKNGNPQEYYYGLLVLHVPFRNENELLRGYESASDAFEAKENLFRPLRPGYTVQQYARIADELDHLIVQRRLMNDNQNIENSADYRNFAQNLLSESQNVIQDGDENQLQALNNNRAASRRIQHEEEIKTFNVNQRQIYNMFKNYIRQEQAGLNPKPIRVFITGDAGAGKTFLVKKIIELFELMYYDSNHKGANYVLKMALTGAAANLIGGTTIHSSCKLPVDQLLDEHQYNEPIQELSGIRLERGREEWKHYKLAVCDECSLIDQRMFRNMAQRFRSLSPYVNDNVDFDCWGNMPVIVVGDFLQLPPITHRPFYRRRSNNEYLPLWDCFNFCELRENMRQAGDQQFISLLNNLRFGTLSAEQIQMLIDKVIVGEPTGIFADNVATRILTKNDEVDAHNQKVLKQHSRETSNRIYRITAVDQITVKNKPGDLELDKITPTNLNLTAGIPKHLDIAVGARVMLRSNINVSKGLVNGAFGTITGITWSNFRLDQLETGDLPECVRIKFDMIRNEVDIFTKTVSFDAIKKVAIIERTMIPIILAWGVTSHKLQGHTIHGGAVIDLGPNLFEAGQAYVMLSRVTSMDNFVLSDFAPNKFQPGFGRLANQEAIAELERLRKLPLLSSENQNEPGPKRIL